MKSSGSKSGDAGVVRLATVLMLSFLILAIWIWVLHWIFARYTDGSYLGWFISNGAEISILMSFFALIWDGLEDREGLLSFHPGEFLAACLALAAIFFFVLTAHLAEPREQDKEVEQDLVSVIEKHWDHWLRRGMLILMGLGVVGWILLVAPLYYLLTLITGAPARQELRGAWLRFVVDPKAPRLEEGVSYRYQRADDPVPDGFLDVSMGKRPFALTNALNAAVLFLADKLLS